MKKLLAMALLLVLVFNMGGYMLLFHYFIKQADEFANQQISKGYYKSSELVEIKIPTRMPYIQEQKEYEPISGQIELSGRNYNYVAMKLTRDTMYVKCVPNYEKTRLVGENIITAKNISDSPLQKKNHPIEKKSTIDNEYNYPVLTYNAPLKGYAVKQSFISPAEKEVSAILSTPAQPPELQGILA